MGTTPACAGKTSPTSSATFSMRDDSRVRREDGDESDGDRSITGRPPRARGRRGSMTGRTAMTRDDPPRARGRPRLERPVPGRPGTTPACAGKTRRGAGPATADRDDPRVRGEDRTMVNPDYAAVGRPPRARGRPSVHSAFTLIPRTTPACAGKTQRCGRRPGPAWDDPRVRGEDVTFSPTRNVDPGRPPRARGRPLIDRRPPVENRTTSACAGRTGGDGGARPARGDDPRVRGEDASIISHICSRAGRPPRARGRRTGLVRRQPRHGTTPACAGKTFDVGAGGGSG